MGQMKSESDRLRDAGFVSVNSISQEGVYEFVCPKCGSAQGYNCLIADPEQWKDSPALKICSSGCKLGEEKLFILYRPR